MRDITLATTFYQLFTTRAFATGVPTTLAGTPVVSAYENDSVTQITAGITLGVDHDGVTGLHLLTVVATGANGYESGKDYALVITTGTVGGVSVVGEVAAEFTIERSAAAVDLANGTDGLTAIKGDTAAILVDTGTTLDGRIPAALVGGRIDASVGAMAANVMTAAAAAGDLTTELQAGLATAAALAVVDGIVDDILVDTAAIGAAGAGLTDLGGMSTTMKAQVQTEAEDALVVNNLDHLLKVAAVAGDAVDSSIVARLASKSATPSFASFVNTTDALEAIRDKETDIETDTTEIGAAGAGLTALGDTRLANLDATVSSRTKPADTQARVTLVDTLTTYTGNTPQTGDVFPLASTEIADIKAKTDNLPSDPADESLIIAATDAIMTRLGVAGAGLTDLGGMSTTMKAQVETEALDALRTQLRDQVPADGTRPTYEEALYMIAQYLTDRGVIGTTCTVRKPDGSTALFTLTLNDATNPTDVTRAT